LIPLVLVVWGNIFYQIFGIVSSDDDDQADDQNVGPVVKNEIKKDTFSIIADYRDPFLGRQSAIKNPVVPDNGAKKQPSDNKKEKKEKKEEQVIPNLKWPQMVYSGLVINKKSSDVVGLLSVNSKQFLVRKGQMVEGLTVGNISSDSITIVMGENIKTLTK